MPLQFLHTSIDATPAISVRFWKKKLPTFQDVCTFLSHILHHESSLIPELVKWIKLVPQLAHRTHFGLIWSNLEKFNKTGPFFHAGLFAENPCKSPPLNSFDALQILEKHPRLCSSTTASITSRLRPDLLGAVGDGGGAVGEDVQIDLVGDVLPRARRGPTGLR
jgi:hypothetical protein